MWKYDKRDFSIRFLYEKYNTESNIARYLIPRRDLVVCFFVKFFRCFSVLFLLVFPLSASNLIFFMLMSTESVLIYRFYKIYSPLEYTGHSFRKEELKFFIYKRCKQQFYNYYLHYLLCALRSFWCYNLFLFRYELNKYSKI